MKRLFVVLIALMAALGGLAWWWGAADAETPGDAFTTAPIDYGPMTETVSATGTLQPQEIIPVGTDLVGKVVEVAADFNQIVHEGDLLFRLDDRAAKQKLRQAEAAVRLARAEVDRANAGRDAAKRSFQRLNDLPENVSLRKDLDVAEAQLQAAEAGVRVAEGRVREAEEGQALAELGVRLTEVRVPVVTRDAAVRDAPAGVGLVAGRGPPPTAKRRYTVLDRKVDLNGQIGPPTSAQAFLLAGDLAQMHVVLQVAESDIGRVRRGQRVDFGIASHGDEVRFAGRVTDLRLTPTTERGAVYYKVLVEAANTQEAATGEWQLRPGMTASADVAVRRREATWKVPLAALNLEMPEELQSDTAKAVLARWRASAEREAWQPVWVVGSDGAARPVLVRVGGADVPIRDVSFGEVFGWDATLTPTPDPNAPTTWPRVVVNVRPPNKSGLFNLPKVKI